MSPSIVLVLNSASTFFLAGLVWMVQVVHYPLFAQVGITNFIDYERQHAYRITFIVAPVMLLELLTALSLAAMRPRYVPSLAVATGLALVVLIWISTLLLQAPRHGRLALGFDAAVLSSLVATNWIRTLAWTLRSVLVAWMLYLGLVRAGQ